MDLHLHTPASHDYEQPEKGYLDILKQAERRGLDMIAFTDHNTANGYRNMTRETWRRARATFDRAYGEFRDNLIAAWDRMED